MKKKHLITALLIFFIVIGGIFIWRTYYYYDRISSGDVSFADFDELRFTDRLTTNQLAQAVASNDEDAFFDVITEDDPSIGNPEALLTIVEFADFGCPYSQDSSYTVRRLAEIYGDYVRYVYRDFPLTDIHPGADLAAEAGECAHDQDKFWEYHDKLYQNQNDLSTTSLIQYARQVGLDEEEFTSCLSSRKHQKEVANDLLDGQAAGVYGTPTFFFNGYAVPGSIPESIFEQLILAFVQTVESVDYE